MSDASSKPAGQSDIVDKPTTTEVSGDNARPTKSSKANVIGQTVAVLLVLAGGALAGKYVMSIQRPVATNPHAHGPSEKKDGHGHGSHDGHDHGNEKKVVKLSPAQIKNAQLTIEEAGPAKIRESVVLNGIIQPNEEQVVAVSPRFGGVVRAVRKRLGDSVKQGEVVASIESNESLTQYQLTAPMAGTVIERKGVLGEFADKDKRLMVIADLTSVWVDFRVYQQDFTKLKLGLPVEVSLNGITRASTISYISPIGLTDTQSMLARAVLDNKDGAFRPGLFVNGRVRLGEQPAAVAVKLSAFQSIDNKPVVFVEGKEGFEAREVEVGLKDDELAEVIFGVVAGDKVVTGNSFVLKAEIGKGQATHEH